MNFEHTITVNSPQTMVAAFFEDVPAVAACVPGLQDFEETGSGSYTGSLKIRLGPVGFTVAGDARVSHTADGTWRMNGEGHDRRVGAGATVTIEARLAELDPDTTEVRVDADIQLSGRLAELGQPLIRRKADALVRDFARNLQQALA